MAKMKICEIAKSLNMKSTELIKMLNENGFTEAKAPQSNIEDNAISWILQRFRGGAAAPAKETAPEPEKKSEEAKETQKASTPKSAMPRRAVYSTDDPDNKLGAIREQEKKAAAKKAEEQAKNNQAEDTSKSGKADESSKTEEKSLTPEQQKTNPKKEEIKKEDMKKEAPQNTEKTAAHSEKTENTGRQSNDRKPSQDRDNRGRDDRNREDRGSRSDRGGQRQGNRDNRDGRQNRSDNGNGQNRGRQDRRPNDGSFSQNRSGQGGRDNRDNRDGRDRNHSGQRSFNGNGQGQGRPDNRQGDNRGGQRNGNFRPSGERSERSSGGFGFEVPASKNNGGRGNGYNNKKQKDKEKNSWENKERQKKKDPNRKGAFIKPVTPPKPKEPEDSIKNIIIPESLTIKDLADAMKQPPAAVVKKLFLGGKMYSINQEVTFEEAEEIALEFNCIAELEEKVDVIEELLKEEEEDEALLRKRPPVVCVMGHVDHGKTSLLDAIRETRVTEKEAGGITQHIGAYVVESNGEPITFLDTPGHEAFTSMRMRGAQSTDIAILVVAADDGVMPQTVEAISHAKAAGVEIIVAINKIDKESANIERVKQELTEYELIPEDWGGSTIFVPVSAHTKEGIEQLLEMILLTAEVMELKSNPDRNARGIVIEAQLDKGRGPVATVLVQKGTLHVGDAIAIGSSFGKVRAMVDDTGRRVKTATPSTPVEIIGLNEVPAAGEVFLVTENEKEARNIAQTYIKQDKERLIGETKAKLSLDGLFSQIQAGNIKELNIIVKADVQGSVEAVKQSLLKLSNEEVAIRIIHGGVGAINESDVTLASASNAIIIGFNIRPDNMAKDLADREKVDLRLYKVIYNAIEDVEAAMKGMLDPVFEEKIIGHAEVRQLFKASGVGTIAGSYVLDGKLVRGCSVRITREDEKIFEGPLASLKRFKDDVKEVASGYECGLVFEKFNDIKEGDVVEAYVMEEVPR